MMNEEEQEVVRSVFRAYINDLKAHSTKTDRPTFKMLEEVKDKVIKALEQTDILEKIRVEIVDCLKALDEIEKSGFNIYLPNEILARRLTYQQCLEFIDKYKTESEDAK